MTTDVFTISDGKISVHGKVLFLPRQVTEAKTYLDLIIVKVESPAGTIFNRNVFGLSKKRRDPLADSRERARDSEGQTLYRHTYKPR
jgi:hypothetical protein